MYRLLRRQNVKYLSIHKHDTNAYFVLKIRTWICRYKKDVYNPAGTGCAHERCVLAPRQRQSRLCASFDDIDSFGGNLLFAGDSHQTTTTGASRVLRRALMKYWYNSAAVNSWLNIQDTSPTEMTFASRTR